MPKPILRLNLEKTSKTIDPGAQKSQTKSSPKPVLHPRPIGHKGGLARLHSLKQRDLLAPSKTVSPPKRAATWSSIEFAQQNSPFKLAAPRYPRRALLSGLEGIVEITGEIRHGRFQALRIKRSSGHHTLDQSALKALRSWRFDAKTHMDVIQTVAFELN